MKGNSSIETNGKECNDSFVVECNSPYYPNCRTGERTTNEEEWHPIFQINDHVRVFVTMLKQFNRLTVRFELNGDFPWISCLHGVR